MRGSGEQHPRRETEAVNLSDEGKRFIKSKERLRLEAYQDEIGVWTIGWGHIVGVKSGEVCTIEQAEAWFAQDVAPCEACVSRLVSTELTQGQFDALCSFAFNLGCTALRNSTLLRLLNAGDAAGAAEQFSRWNHAGGEVSAGLSARREQEREMFVA
jgi:lysozyme